MTTPFGDLLPAEKIRICREIQAKYPDEHPQRQRIEEQIERYNKGASL